MPLICPIWSLGTFLDRGIWPTGQEVHHLLYYMAGAGGNKIAVIPKLDLAVVLSITLFGQCGAHQQTEEILNAYIIPAAGK